MRHVRRLVRCTGASDLRVPPRIEQLPVLVREAADGERAMALELFRRDFGRIGLVAFGQVMNLDALPRSSRR